MNRRPGAILLAGGRGSRMGGVRKPLLEVGGTTLLDAALAAVRAVEAEPVVVVGPADPAHAGLTWVREDPPFGGPAAAILAALPRIDAETTLVIGCDLPRAADAVRMLIDAPLIGDGSCLADAAGSPQWLIGLYRTQALRAAAAALGDGGRDAPVRALLGGLAIRRLPAPAALVADVDTWEDLNRAREMSEDA